MNVLKRFLVVAALLTCTAAVPAAGASPAQQDPVYDPPTFDGRVGEIQFHNGSQYPVTVTLWHPDNGLPFAHWRIDGGDTVVLYYHKKPINIGSDWGVQIGDSEVCPVSDVADWRSRPQATWKTSVTQFFDD